VCTSLDGFWDIPSSNHEYADDCTYYAANQPDSQWCHMTWLGGKAHLC